MFIPLTPLPSYIYSCSGLIMTAVLTFLLSSLGPFIFSHVFDLCYCYLYCVLLFCVVYSLLPSPLIICGLCFLLRLFNSVRPIFFSPQSSVSPSLRVAFLRPSCQFLCLCLRPSCILPYFNLMASRRGTRFQSLCS